MTWRHHTPEQIIHFPRLAEVEPGRGQTAQRARGGRGTSSRSGSVQCEHHEPDETIPPAEAEGRGVKSPAPSLPPGECDSVSFSR